MIMRPSKIMAAAVLTAVCLSAARPVQAQTDVAIQSLNLEGVNFNAVTGTLTATGGSVTGTLGGLPFTTDITNFVLQKLSGRGNRCAILNLALDPIHIALLGLHVDTSPICLDITAMEGQGVLGELLCGLAGGNLGLLGSADLLSGLSDILTRALGRAKAPHGHGHGASADEVCTGECEVLDLVLGPLKLNLLGVKVNLDDCDDGPVEVCISATAAEGLLGDLLCALTDNGLLEHITLEELLGLIQDLLT